ncbi:hypothetical protein FJZ53_00495 [Candidatus Woesearchaeota archaeon]|nr:hypothetical protein [Candidatus Woesearchaeota archaeon]
MRTSLENYVNKVLGEAKGFLKDQFPEIYQDIGIKIGVKYAKEKTDYDYTMAYNPGIKWILLLTSERPEKPKDDDIVKSALGIKMKRKNAYLTSIIHEIGEAMYLKELKNRNMTISYYDIDVSHTVATSLEIHALEKLIQQSTGEDKKDFMRRKKARMKEIKKYKLKGV